jgi:two-component system chemotaxis response regulator CheB
MATRDIIVIGASAGGLDAVSRILKGLPERLPASIFIVIHTSPEGPGLLSGILNGISTLPVTTAQNRERIIRGQIYVAPPDFHMVLARGHIQINKGPREHRFRPAVDPLFRSAAQYYGPRVIGIVLSGNLGDGAHGLMAIKQRGGVAIVQDPTEAMIPVMPRNAIDRVTVDYVLPAEQMSATLAELTMVSVDDKAPGTAASELPSPEKPGGDALETGALHGPPSPFTCPECGGTLWELQSGKLVRYRCHVGHGFTEDSLLASQNGKLEETLWSALRALEESLELRRRMAERGRQRNLHAIVPGLEQEIRELEKRADGLRGLLLDVPKLRRERKARRARPRTRTRRKKA